VKATRAIDLALTVDHGVDGFDVTVFKSGDGFGLSEVDAAGEFTHTEDVETIRDEFVFDG